jgi:hypothetical protein
MKTINVTQPNLLKNFLYFMIKYEYREVDFLATGKEIEKGGLNCLPAKKQL